MHQNILKRLDYKLWNIVRHEWIYFEYGKRKGHNTSWKIKCPCIKILRKLAICEEWSDIFTKKVCQKITPKFVRKFIILFFSDGAWYFFEIKVCLVSHQESWNFIPFFKLNFSMHCLASPLKTPSAGIFPKSIMPRH